MIVIGYSTSTKETSTAKQAKRSVVDSTKIGLENNRYFICVQVYHCIQNLFAGLAMYSGVVVVGRLAGLVGLLLYVLTGMAILAPIVFSVTILLLDLQLSSSLRFQQPTKIGIASFRSCILDLVPLGLLICWTFSQCRVTRREKSSREMSSNLIAAASILLHLVGLAQYVVYVMLNTATDLDFKVSSSLTSQSDSGSVSAAAG